MPTEETILGIHLISDLELIPFAALNNGAIESLIRSDYYIIQYLQLTMWMTHLDGQIIIHKLLMHLYYTTIVIVIFITIFKIIFMIIILIIIIIIIIIVVVVVIIIFISVIVTRCTYRVQKSGGVKLSYISVDHADLFAVVDEGCSRQSHLNHVEEIHKHLSFDKRHLARAILITGL